MLGVYKNRTGVWCVYYYDASAQVRSVHLTCIDAARQQSRQGYGYVLFWPFEMELADAIAWWNSTDNTIAEVQKEGTSKGG